VANKAIGGLAVYGAEVCFAIDHSGCDAVLPNLGLAPRGHRCDARVSMVI
jgi:hypothetical protein